MDTQTPGVDAIFLAALEKAAPGERAAYLTEACGADTALRARVERMLEAYPRVADFLEAPAPGLSSLQQEHAAASALWRGFVDRALGDFSIVRQLGRGGMGIVYEAEQLSLRRRVALKILPFLAVLDPKQLQRFRNEALAAAALKHPNIVGVHAVGCELGVHYYAMEFVQGVTLADVIAEERQKSDRSPRGDPKLFERAANWGIQAAEALEHAHEMGIVHRDVKPSNLLINSHGNLLVTDFGLAHTRTDATLTMSGDVLGTLRYMSPEQALGNRRMLDHHTDIYSLGVTLYELLTLQPPFQSDDRHALIHEILDGNPPPLRQLNPAIPRDLETIVLKAMAVEPAARYVTAQHLADDLKRFLTQKPIQAHRPTMPDRAAKWTRRHWPVVWSVAVALLLAVIGLTVSIVLVTGAYERERHQHELADQRANELRHYLYAADLKLAHEAWKRADIEKAREFLIRRRPQFGESDLRGFEWRYLWALCQQSQVTLTRHSGEVYCLAFSTDGSTLASASQDGTVKLWDATSRELWQTIRVHAGELSHVAFSPDGATLVATGDDGMVKLFETATGSEKGVLEGHSEEVFGAAFSPDGRLLATWGCDDTIRLWKTETLREEAILRGHTGDVQSLAFSPDGSTLASVSSDEMLKVWDVTTRTERAKAGGHGKLSWVTYSRDGRTIATCGSDRTVRIWLASDLSEIRCLQGHTNVVHCVAFSPTDNRLASASRDGSIRLWDAGTGELLNVLRGHTDRVWCVAFTPDGRTLATAAGDHTIKLWDATARQDCRRGPTCGAMVHDVRFAPDGTLLVSTMTEVLQWNCETSSNDRKAQAFSDVIVAAAFSADGRTVAIGNMSGAVRLWSADRGELQAELGRHGIEPNTGPVQSLAFSADGAKLASYSRTDGQLKLWDVAAERTRPEVTAHREPLSIPVGDSVFSLAFAPDGRTVAAGSNRGVIQCFDTASGQERRSLQGGPDETVLCLAFSPDGTMLATAGDDRVVRLWDMATGTERHTLVGHSDWIESLAFTPDGKTLASASRDSTLRFWSPTSGHELLTLETPIVIQHLTYSPDGLHLAGSGSQPDKGGEVYLWSGVGGGD